VPNAFGEGLTLRPIPIPTPVDGGPKRDAPVAGVVDAPNMLAEADVPPNGGVAVDCEPKRDELVGVAVGVGVPNKEPVVGGVVVGVPNKEPLLDPKIDPPGGVGVDEGPKILDVPPTDPKGELPKGDVVGVAPNKLGVVEGVGLAGIRLPEDGVSENGFGAVLAAKGLAPPLIDC